MDSGMVKVDRRGAVLLIRMTRPKKLNAQSPALINAMDGAFEVGVVDPDIRVVVLSNEGQAFSAGHDLEYPGYVRRGYTYQTWLEMERELFIEKLLRIRNLPRSPSPRSTVTAWRPA